MERADLNQAKEASCIVDTFKKVGSYASIVTVVGAITAAPVQANSLGVLTQGSLLEEQNFNLADASPDNLQAEGVLTPLIDQVQEWNQASQVATYTDADGKTVYVYSGDTTDAGGNSSLPQTVHSSVYSTVLKAAEPPPPRKVPEPSAILGLSAVSCIVAVQRRLKK